MSRDRGSRGPGPSRQLIPFVSSWIPPSSLPVRFARAASRIAFMRAISACVLIAAGAVDTEPPHELRLAAAEATDAFT